MKGRRLPGGPRAIIGQALALKAAIEMDLLWETQPGRALVVACARDAMSLRFGNQVPPEVARALNAEIDGAPASVDPEGPPPQLERWRRRVAGPHRRTSRAVGHAPATTAEWAALIRPTHRFLFYSTSRTNRASQRVAAHLGLRRIGYLWQLQSVRNGDG